MPSRRASSRLSASSSSTTRRIRRGAIAAASIGDYIESFYNLTRLHSHLDYFSPIEFELRKIVEEKAAYSRCPRDRGKNKEVPMLRIVDVILVLIRDLVPQVDAIGRHDAAVAKQLGVR